MSVLCPACNSSEVTSKIVSECIKIPYGPDAKFTTQQYRCSRCGVEGDFTDSNTSIIKDAVRVCTEHSILTMLSDLEKMGVQCPYLERALRIPPGRTEDWRAGLISFSELALLRLIRTYPWLLEVADSNFNDAIVLEKEVAQIEKQRSYSQEEVNAAIKKADEIIKKYKDTSTEIHDEMVAILDGIIPAWQRNDVAAINLYMDRAKGVLARNNAFMETLSDEIADVLK